MTYYLISLLLLYPIWKIYKKVGLSPWISLIVLLPGGTLICALILANSEWKTYSNGGK